MMRPTVLVSLALALFCSSALGEDRPSSPVQTLIRVTNDRDTDVSRLSAIVDDDGLLRGMRIETQSADPARRRMQNFTLKQLATARGAVIAKASGYDAVILNGKVEAGKGVGHINIKYLTSALSSQYASCRAVVRRTSGGQWQLMNAYTNRQVREAFVETHMTGVTTIKGICPGY